MTPASASSSGLKRSPRYSDAWKLLGDLCDAVAHEKNRPDAPQVKVRFFVDVPTHAMGFSLSADGQEQRFLLGYMYLFEPKPEGMPELLWEVFRMEVHRMHDLADLIEQGVARADLATALGRKLFKHDLQEAQASIASRHRVPLEVVSGDKESKPHETDRHELLPTLLSTPPASNLDAEQQAKLTALLKRSGTYSMLELGQVFGLRAVAVMRQVAHLGLGRIEVVAYHGESRRSGVPEGITAEVRKCSEEPISVYGMGTEIGLDRCPHCSGDVGDGLLLDFRLLIP